MGTVVASKKQQAATVAGVTAKLAGTIGDMIDQLALLRDRKRELEAQVAVIEGEYAGVEEQLVEKLAQQGIDASRGTKASCSISKTVVASVTDWDKVYAYVKRTGHFQIFQRRIADAAYRELLEAGKKVPGAEPFIKKRLNLKSL
jgi:hypothetical protein